MGEKEALKLYFEKSGHEKQSLILLHGNGEDHSIFDKAVPLLAEKFTVYALDSRGQGKSPAVREYHYDDMATDVIAFIKEQKIRKPILYGFSDGGIIALLVAIREPDLLKSIAVSGANLTPDCLKPFWSHVFRFAARLARKDILEMMLREPHISLEMLQTIKVPALVMAGTRDMIKEEQTRAIAGNIKVSKLMILQGESHGSYIVNKDKFAQILLDETEFLTQTLE